MDKVKVGAVCRLKSGGPLMTVQDYDCSGGNVTRVSTDWFVNGICHSGRFVPEGLDFGIEQLGSENYEKGQLIELLQSLINTLNGEDD